MFVASAVVASGFPCLRPVPGIVFAGLHDPVYTYARAQATFAFGLLVDGCGSSYDRVTFGTSYCDTYRSCSAGVQAELCSIEADPVSIVPGHILYANPDLEVATTAWDFLAEPR